MPECGFSLVCVFPYNRIVNFVLIEENTLWDVIYSGIFYRVCCQSSTFCIFLTTQILVKKVFFILFSKFFIGLLNKQRELYLINYLNIHLLLKLYQTLLPKNLSREERDWSKYLRCSSSKVSDAFL